MASDRNGFPPSLRAALLALLLTAPAACEPGESAPSSADRDAARAAYREGLGFFREEALDEAIAACRRAIELDPDLAEAHWVLGKVLYFRSDVVIGTPTRDDALLAEAAAELARASALAPDNVEYVFWTGRAQALLGDAAAAESSFQRALALDPTYGKAYKELALVLRDAGEESRARQNFERAIELLEDDADLWFHYGMQLEMDEELEGARAAYERSRTLDWTVPRTYSRLAVLLERLGDPDGAQRASLAFEEWSDYGQQINTLLSKAHADRTNVEAMIAVGELYMSARRYRAASVWLRRACSVDPDNKAARLALESAETKLAEEERS